jgi:hypothetical protein
MKVRWLGWAGVEIESEGQSVVIDLLGDPLGVLAAVPDIAARTQMPQVVAPRNEGRALAGLCTHLHRDQPMPRRSSTRCLPAHRLSTLPASVGMITRISGYCKQSRSLSRQD